MGFSFCKRRTQARFNSFLPALLPDTIGEKLVNAWLDRLEKCPEFHDKVEFEVALTCLDFCFIHDFKTRYPGVLEADRRPVSWPGLLPGIS